MKKKIEKLVENEEVISKKSVEKKENRQLFWFFTVVAVVFASVLIPYFWVESSKNFEFIGADWMIEEYAEPTGTIYHGRFLSFNNPNLYYNIFFSTDPRENGVPTEGTFDRFKVGGIISVSPEFNLCRGESSGAMMYLSGFLGTGVGVGPIDSGFTDNLTAIENGKQYVTCENVLDRTLVIVDRGEARVVQDEKNPYCYTIYIEDCDDASPVEKFMLKALDDFGRAYNE